MEPAINVQIGSLPRTGDQSVLFFANLRSIFYENRGQTDYLSEQVGGLETYGNRLIPVLNLIYRGQENVLLLERPPDAALVSYFRRDLGLSLPEVKVLRPEIYARLRASLEKSAAAPSPEIAALQALNADRIDGFVTDRTLVDLATALGKSTVSTQEGSVQGNNKKLLLEHMRDRGFPTFDTRVAATTDEIGEALTGLGRCGYRQVVIKAQIGASGIGMVKLPVDSTPPYLVPEFFFFEGPVLVQGWLEPGVRDVIETCSPSVQLFVSDDSVSLYDLTEQILGSGMVHQGNVAPPTCFEGRLPSRKDLLEQAGVAGQWLHRQGYRGMASADFLMVVRQGRVEVIICELNARVTGATYPAVLARHFNSRGAWLMRNIRFKKEFSSERLLHMMDKANRLYRPGQKFGILPINLNPTDAGHLRKGQFLFIAAELAACQKELDLVKGIFDDELEYDRD